MSKRSLLIIATEYPPFVGGIGRYASELAAAAAEDGIDVHVVAPSHGCTSLPFASADSTLHVNRYRTSSDFRFRDVFRARARVRSAMRSHSFDFVHASDYRALVIAKMAGVRRRGLLVTFHGSDVKGAGRFKRLSQKFLVRSTFVIANSAHTSRLIEQRLGSPANRVTPLGVRPALLDCDLPRRDCREWLDVAHDRVVLLCVARFERRKAQDVLAAAANRLPSDVARLTHIVFVGTGDAQFQETVRRHAEASDCRVSFLGRISDQELAMVYRAADAFVLLGRTHPTRVEGFGLVYLEAGICELPIVAANVDAIPEVVLDGRNGLIVQEDDPQDAAWAISQLVRDATLRRTLGKRGAEIARRYTWQETSRQTYGQQ